MNITNKNIRIDIPNFDKYSQSDSKKIVQLVNNFLDQIESIENRYDTKKIENKSIINFCSLKDLDDLRDLIKKHEYSKDDRKTIFSLISKTLLKLQFIESGFNFRNTNILNNIAFFMKIFDYDFKQKRIEDFYKLVEKDPNFKKQLQHAEDQLKNNEVISAKDFFKDENESEKND